MIDLLPLPYKIGILAVVVAFIAVFSYFQGYDNAYAKYAQFKAEVLEQQAINAREAERAKAESERINKDVVHGWRSAVEYLRDHPRTVTVRMPAHCDPTGLRPISGSTEGLRPAPSEPGLGAVIDVTECETRLNKAVLDAAQVEHIRAWAKQQSEIKR